MIVSPIQSMQQAMLRCGRSPDFEHSRVSMGLAARQFARGRLGFFGASALQSAGSAYSGASAGAALSGTTVIGSFAAAGSVLPIVGTAIGALIGLAVSGVFNHKVDPEVGNFNNAMALVRQSGPQAVLNIQDKYLVLAGLFDLEPSQIKGNIPIYKKYGRMGEFHFVNDMCNLIQNAANQGIITANDTVQSVYDKVVAPWINGFGYGPMQDSNSEMITQLLIGLIGEYVTGQYKNRWYSVGGDFQFGSLPPFTLPPQNAVTPSPSGTPTQGPSLPAPTPPTSAVPAQPGPVTAAPQVPVRTSVSVPAGFTMAGNANGLAAYTGPDGFYYSWNGSTLSPLTGPLNLLSGGQIQVISGIAQAAPGQPSTPQSLPQALPVQSTPQPVYYPQQPTMMQTPQGPTIISVPQNAPAQAATAAGFSGAGLPSWLTWGAVAAVAALMFATARPIGPTPRRRYA